MRESLPLDSTIAQHGGVRRYARDDPLFARAIAESAAFYSARTNLSSPERPDDAAIVVHLRRMCLDCRAPGWALKVALFGIVSRPVQFECPAPGEESQIDYALRPLRRVLYALLGLGEVTEHVRVDKRCAPVVVQAMPPGEVMRLTGAQSLLELLAMGEADRIKALVMMLHHPLDLSKTLIGGFAPSPYTLLPLLDPLFVDPSLSSSEGTPFRPAELALRYLVVTHVVGRVSRDTPHDSARMALAWEWHALCRMRPASCALDLEARGSGVLRGL